MKKSIKTILALLPVVAACAVEPVPSTLPANGPEIVVSTEGVSRTTLASDFKVNWASGDAISVFDGTSNVKYTTTETTPAAAFTVAEGTLATVSEYYALYPYSATATLEGSTIKTVIPNYQVGVKGGFDPKAQVMVGKGTGVSFAMKNVVALLKVTIPSDVTAVSIANKAGVPIAGNTSIVVGNDGVPTSITAEAASVLLVPSADTFEAGDYFVAVAPGAMTGGLHVTMTKSGSDNLWVADSDNACTFYRSEVMNLGDLAVKTTEKTMTKISILFSDGSAYKAPFAEPAKFSNSEGTADYGGSPIQAYFKEACNSFQWEMFAERGFTQNTAGGLRCCRDTGDYVEFPVINGTRLAAVKILNGAATDSSLNPSPALTDVAGAPLIGGEAYRVQAAIATGHETLWVPVGNGNNVACRLTAQANSSRWVAFRQLDLYYEGNPTTTVAYVKTAEADATGTSATLHGSVGMYSGSIGEISCGFEYRELAGTDWTSIDIDTPSAIFSKDVVLPVGDYIYRAWASVGGVRKHGAEKSVSFYTGLTISIKMGGPATAAEGVKNASGAVIYKNSYYFPSNGQASVNATYRNDNKIVEYDFKTGYTFRLWATYGISRATTTINAPDPNEGSWILGLRYNPFSSGSYGATNGRGWMQLPALPSMKLKSVKWTTSAASSRFKWSLVSAVTTDSEASPATCSIATGAKNFGTMDFTSATVQTINVAGSEAGVGYYMVTIAATYNVNLTEMELVYAAD